MFFRGACLGLSRILSSRGWLGTYIDTEASEKGTIHLDFLLYIIYLSDSIILYIPGKGKTKQLCYLPYTNIVGKKPENSSG